MPNLKSEWKKLALIVGVFLACCWIPVGAPWFDGAVREALHLVRWYAREHVILCLVPAFFIAGAIGAFVRQASVLRHLGARANQPVAYAVASVSGSVLAVCSCTVLPLFAGIYRMGAGLGPAIAFLYSGPAINVLAMVLTARVLGLRLGLARAVGAVVFSVVIGVLMHAIFREEQVRVAALPTPAAPAPRRALWQDAGFFATLIAILVFANWARSGDVRAVFLCCPNGLSTYRVEGRILDRTPDGVRLVDTQGREHTIPRGQLVELAASDAHSAHDIVYAARWLLVALALVLLAAMVRFWFDTDELHEWVAGSWEFALQILPLLFAGVLVSGFLFGRPGHDGLIPARYIEALVGAKPDVFLRAGGLLGTGAEGAVRALWPLWTNFFASVVGAFMYFATLTEVPIVQGLLGSGMGRGPALALLLAGPALSLPSVLVIRGVLGVRKTVAYVALVVSMATVSGLLFGALAE